MQNDQNAEVVGNNQGNPPAAEETQTLNSPAQVEGAGNAPEATGSDGKAFDVQKFFVNNKRVTDGLRSELRELKELITQRFQPAPSQPPPAVENEFDWTNPKNAIQKEVQSYLSQSVKPVFEQERLIDRQNRAKEYLLSQDYIDPQSEEAKGELDSIFTKYGFDHAWKINPELAAEGILEIYKSKKGIGKTTPPKVQAGAVLSGSAQNGNKSRTWTSKDVAALSSQDYEKYRTDIEAAYKEGRYRE